MIGIIFFIAAFIAESPIYNARETNSYFEQCYEVEDKLGRGSFGEVFKVRCKEDGRIYACKKTIFKFRGDSDRLVAFFIMQVSYWNIYYSGNLCILIMYYMDSFVQF